LGIGGNVDANWTVIRPLAAQSDGGEILFFLKDHAILVQGGANGYSIYAVVTRLVASGVTGFRMEAPAHHALPFRGSGRPGAAQRPPPRRLRYAAAP
jgi:hypothetical protein